MMSARPIVLKLHRYIGLALAVFLIIIAATGAIIAFYNELETTINAKQRVVEPQEPRWTLRDLLVIRERLEKQDPRSHVFSLQFPQSLEESVFSRVMGAINPATGEPYNMEYNEVFANPYTGERLGERRFGNFSLQPEDLVSQIYYLHYALVLPELTGALFVGILGLIWAVDCFFGFYLTLPPGGKAPPGEGKKKGKKKRYWSRWKPAWQVKLGAAANRVIYDLHRATGLWLWPLLLIFAVSGFALNQAGPYAQFVSKITDYAHFQELPPSAPLAQPLLKPPVDWFEALDLGQRYAAEQAQLQGFTLGKAAALEYRRDLGLYFFSVHTSRDLLHGSNPTETNSPATAATIAIDARDGGFLGIQVPTGQRAGNTVTSWIIALHVASIWGLAWQIAVSAIGVVIVLISITGVLIWWRKRKSRQGKVRSGGAPSETAVPEQHVCNLGDGDRDGLWAGRKTGG